MQKRISYVQRIDILSLGPSCVAEIGDTEKLTPRSHVLALQREQPIFFDDELNFRDYSMFCEEIPQPIVNEQMEMMTVNQSPFIRVKDISINNVAASAIVHLGSTNLIRSEARAKNIRHLLRYKDESRLR
ncbi:spore germination protein GerPE [Brevibacillus ruminantium]|uniref:Spore germination protein GerPE n=1 Tax=Brevibacillus ruminantium TaxID=2950604 RepID=A0ABY4WJE3_9BACL|nr:spore germination protein GerPE [Brevibacillus ruminantium]USG66182.1 spore germination protein GerPE [Brevibacillus ruminantium]